MNDILNLIHGYDIYKDFNYQEYKLNLAGWNGNHPIFEDLIKKIKPNNILEIGTWYGQSTIHMAKIIKNLNLNTKIICIDTWLGSLEFIGLHELDIDRKLFSKNGYPNAYYQFLSNIILEGVQDIIIPFPQTSYLGCKWLKIHNINFDLIYVDGSNEFSDLYTDLKSSWSLLNLKGLMFGDDYNHPIFPGINMALNKFCVEKNLQVIKEDIFWTIEKMDHV